MFPKLTILVRCQWLRLLLYCLLVDLARAQCECGYAMDDTGDYFTHAIYNNFSTFAPSKNITFNSNFTKDWVVQNSGIGQVSLASPLPIWNGKENVYTKDGNLILRQVGYPKESVTAGLNVSVASIASRFGDIYHGSFRTEFKVEGATGGSVGAFFWYHVCALSSLFPLDRSERSVLMSSYRTTITRLILNFWRESSLTTRYRSITRCTQPNNRMILSCRMPQT